MKEEILIFLEHILESIDKIESFSKNISKKELKENDLKQYAIIRAIEVIGEAVKNIPKSFRNKYPNVSWKDIVGTRDKVIHGYFNVDLDIVWEIIKDDIPILKKQIKNILEKEK